MLSLNASEWDYVALGYEHHHRQVRGPVHYGGSLERVGPTPWEEAAEEKGFLTCELESGRVRFHAIHGRPVVSLASIPYEPARPDRLRERVREVLDEVPGGIDEKIVRIRLEGLPPHQLRLLEGVLPEYRARALHLEVQLDDQAVAADVAEDRSSARLASRVAERLADDGGSLEELEQLVKDCLSATQA